MEVVVQMFHKPRLIAVIMVFLIVLVLVGCGNGSTSQQPEEPLASLQPSGEEDLASDPAGMDEDLPALEEDPQEAGQDEASGQEEDELREAVDHEAAFDPQAVRVGDRIAGLEVVEFLSGDEPTEYVIAKLAGQLEVSGRYIQVRDMWLFTPDASSRDRIPHVADQYVWHYRENREVPRLTQLRFDDITQLGIDRVDLRVGRATVIMEDYQVNYVPEVNTLNTESIIQGRYAYLEIGDELLPFVNQYIEDTATPVQVVSDERYHYIEPGLLQELEDVSEYIIAPQGMWQGLTIGLDLLSAWDGMAGSDYSSLVGNHAGVLENQEVELPGIGQALYLVVERDKWDDEIQWYNGVEYEYWLVVLREVPDIRLSGEPYDYAFCLIGYADEMIEDAKERLMDLANFWQVPPEDFYIDK